MAQLYVFEVTVIDRPNEQYDSEGCYYVVATDKLTAMTLVKDLGEPVKAEELEDVYAVQGLTNGR